MVDLLQYGLHLTEGKVASFTRRRTVLTRSSMDEWVAIKILTAEKSQNSRELRSHKRLAKLPQESGLSRFFVQLRDHFFHQGPNGSHLCLVTELLGPRLPVVLEELRDKDTWLAPNIVLKVAQELLEAIEVLHRTGFTHGGMGNPRGVTIIYDVDPA